MDQKGKDLGIKKIRPLLIGCIILLTAARVHGVVYDPPVYETPVAISKGERPFIEGILNFEGYFPVVFDWREPGMPEKIKRAMFDFGGERYGFSAWTLGQVPEPGVLLLLGAGLIALVILGIRKKRRTAPRGKRSP